MAEHFVKNPHNKPQVNHKDGDKSNNKANNLEWVTGSENVVHSYEVLNRIPTYGNRKIPLSDYCRIKYLVAMGIQKQVIASGYSVHPGQIARILKQVI